MTAYNKEEINHICDLTGLQYDTSMHIFSYNLQVAEIAEMAFTWTQQNPLHVWSCKTIYLVSKLHPKRHDIWLKLSAPIFLLDLKIAATALESFDENFLSNSSICELRPESLEILLESISHVLVTNLEVALIKKLWQCSVLNRTLPPPTFLYRAQKLAISLISIYKH